MLLPAAQATDSAEFPASQKLCWGKRQYVTWEDTETKIGIRIDLGEVRVRRLHTTGACIGHSNIFVCPANLGV